MLGRVRDMSSAAATGTEADAPGNPADFQANAGALELCEQMIEIASALFGIPADDLRRAKRGGMDVSRIRQIAMYSAHTVMGLTMKQVGLGFGRDRTTVLHACHLIEDMRDDPEFDRLVTMTEQIARAALRNRGRR